MKEWQVYSLEDLLDEKWVDVLGWEGYYKVSNLGRFKSLKRKTSSGRSISEKILTQNLVKVGYLRVHLRSKNNKSVLSHILIARSFIPNPEGKKEVNHKNADKTDNKVSNLEWATRLENVEHAVLLGLIKYQGEDNFSSKLTNKQVLDIFNSNLPRKVIAKNHGINVEQIYKIKSGATWSTVTGKVFNKAQLGKEKVLEIFNSDLSYKRLSLLFGVSEKTISDIKIGYSWNHITGLPFRKKWKIEKLKNAV